MSEDIPGLEMTLEEIGRFLGDPSRLASVASLRRDGSPVITGVGFDWDGEAMYFSLRSTRLLNKRLARDNRVAIYVFNTSYPVAWVHMAGHAEIVADPDFERALSIMHKSLGPNSETLVLSNLDLDEFDRNYVSVGRTLYRVRPERILSEDLGKLELADHARLGGGTKDAGARREGDT